MTLTTITTCAIPCAGMSRKLAVTVPLSGGLQSPWLWLCVQETKVVPTGKGSVNTTLVAVLGPRLLMVSWYVSWLPETTGSGKSVFVRERSATAPGVGVAVGVVVAVGEGDGEDVGVAATQGSRYWKTPVAVAVHPVLAVTVTSTGVPTATGVPPGVPAGQAGGTAPLSGTVTMTSFEETETMDAECPPTVTLVTLPRFEPAMVMLVPGPPEDGLTELMIGFV